MTIHAISPAFVKIDYHSAYGAHTKTIPTLPWIPDGLGDPGSFTTWDGLGIDADIMVRDLMDKMGEDCNVGVVFDAYTVYQVPDGALHPNPVFFERYEVLGDNATLTGQSQAVQTTLMFKTTLFNDYKFVYLDRANAGIWGNFYSPGATTLAVIAAISAESNGWSGRDGARPFTFTNGSSTFNNRLRRKYDMV